MRKINAVASNKKYDTNGNPVYSITVFVNGERWFKPLRMARRNNAKSGTYSITSYNLKDDLSDIEKAVADLLNEEGRETSK